MQKKKVNRKDYIFLDQENQTLIKHPGDIDGLDFYIANLINC